MYNKNSMYTLCAETHSPYFSNKEKIMQIISWRKSLVFILRPAIATPLPLLPPSVTQSRSHVTSLPPVHPAGRRLPPGAGIHQQMPTRNTTGIVDWSFNIGSFVFYLECKTQLANQKTPGKHELELLRSKKCKHHWGKRVTITRACAWDKQKQITFRTNNRAVR